MQSKLRIDDTGFKAMAAILQKKTGATYRDVVRAITGEVLTLTAQRTKSARAMQIKDDVERVLLKPFTTSSGAKIGVTTQNRVWFSGPGWPRTRWLLLNEQGELIKPGETVSRTRGDVSTGRQARVSGTVRAQAADAIREVKAHIKREIKYRKGIVGLGKASWIQILRELQIPPANMRGLAKASKMVLPAEALAAVYGREATTGRDQFNITVSSRAQTALNPRAGGIPAFARSINGKVKEFRKATEKDLETYVRRFADRHGFTVQSR